MAVAVIGGLVTSTFLSLLIIPVVFTFVDDIIAFVRRLLHRRSGGQAKGDAPPGARLGTRQS
jgi:hypothetical protein